MNVYERKRRERNLTQSELSELMEINRSAISKWESGEAKPTYENLLKLAEIFECSTDELLGREAVEKTKRPSNE